MISMKIEDVKSFMSELLSGSMFDRFLITEAQVKTFVQTRISGAVLRDWYSEDELEKDEQLEEYVRWKQIRPIVFQLVKGKKVPQSLILHFVCKKKNKDVGAIQIQYEEKQLRMITAYSTAEFTLDKSAEFEWDEQCRNFLKGHRIAFREEK